jgi:hypothetical protein
MKRFAALAVLGVMIAAIAAPAGAAPKTTLVFSLKGEARGLELAIGGQGVTLGFALSKADSAPSSLGVGAGQCTFLGSTDDPDSLPCSSDNTARSAYPGNPGNPGLTCSGKLPAPLNEVIKLNTACGASTSSFKKGVATTTSQGQVASLEGKLPVGLRLVPLGLTTEQVKEVVDELTKTLAPVLDLAPKEVRDVLVGAPDTVFEKVDGLLEVIQGLDATDALKVELGNSTSSIGRSGRGGLILKSESFAAGARIGLIGVPGATQDGTLLTEADPLENGLVIIEVGTARASAAVDRNTAAATSAASPALVTVKVRDITSPTPKYVEVSVAPGQTVTVLQGTPAESTITAADSTTEQEAGSAQAAADAVRLHLLKGVNGGVQLGIAGATAAAVAELREEEPEVLAKRPPRILPQTGTRNLTGLTLLLLIGSIGTVAARKRFGN